MSKEHDKFNLEERLIEIAGGIFPGNTLNLKFGIPCVSFFNVLDIGEPKE